MKKLLALLVSAVMVLSMACAVSAAPAGGEVKVTFSTGETATAIVGEPFEFFFQCDPPGDLGEIADGEEGAGITVSSGKVAYSNVSLGGPFSYPTSELVTVTDFDGDFEVIVAEAATQMDATHTIFLTAEDIEAAIKTAEEMAAQMAENPMEGGPEGGEAPPEGAAPAEGESAEDKAPAEGESAEEAAPAEGESAEEAAPAEGESAEGESDGDSAGEPAGPTVTASAEANPDQALTLDGVAMGQVRQLITTASIVYDGGELDEVLSTFDGVTTDGDTTLITLTEDDEVGLAVRNTGAFVLGGESDPDLVAEKINFSYITSSYYPDWEAFCDALGYDSTMSLEDIAQQLVEEGNTSSYTNLGLTAPETVVLSNYVLDLSGAGSNDMGGFGAAVYVSDNASAQLDNFRIITRGPCRGAIFTRFAGSAIVNDSTIYAVSDPTIQVMQGCPPGLFLEGKVRATNAVGASHATYNNSVVVSQGWGALSTDSDDLYTVQGEPTVLDINDSYIAVLTSGYGAYSDGAAEDYFKGSYIDVPDYAAVETGSGIVSFTDSVINSGMYGVMTHSGRSVGDIEFINSELHVGEAGVMLRDTANKVLFDNSTIAFDGTYTINPDAAEEYGADIADIDAEFGTVNGVDESYAHTIYRAEDSNCIVKLIHNSDGGSGTEETEAAPEVTIRDCVMTGDILNTAAMTGDEYTATFGPAGEGIRTPRSLEVSLEGSDITGAISLGQDTWEVTYFASGENASQEIGYAASTELGMYREDDFGLSLSMDGSSVWNVTEDSYLTALNIEEGAQILGSEVSMTVDGVETPIEAGTYEGEIVITVTPAEGEPQEGGSEGGPALQTEEYEITVGDITAMAQYEDLAADSEQRAFKITFDGEEYTGKIDKGVWTADDPAGEEVIAAYQAAHEADPNFMGAPDGDSEGGESPEGESPEGEAPADNTPVEFDMTHPIAGDIHVIVEYETDDNGDIQLISVVDPELGEDILPVQDEDTIAMIIELVKQQ